MVCKLNRLAAGAGIALFVFALLAMTLQIAAAKSKKTQVPEYCQQIAQSDPRLSPLAGVCEFALSQSNLPNLVCHERMQSFIGDSLQRNWRERDLVTAEVTFERGKGDLYANVEVNNHPIRELARPHGNSDVGGYLGGNDWLDLGHFGLELLTVFTPSNKASFQYKDEVTIAGQQLVVFELQVKRKNNSTYALYSGEGSFTPDGYWLAPGLEGLIWVDKKTSLLRRLVLHATEIDRAFPIDAFATATDYNLVTIPGLGDLLLPTSGESMVCKSRKQKCWRTEVTFENCHKFAGKARIVPAQ